MPNKFSIFEKVYSRIASGSSHARFEVANRLRKGEGSRFSKVLCLNQRQ